MKLSLYSFLTIASSLFAGVRGRDNDGGFCDTTVHPDPHFKTWSNIYYDYHGGCDLVLIKNSIVNLHIRTVPVSGYSFISKAALRIGGGTLVVNADSSYTFSGPTPFVIGAYPWSLTSPSYGSTFEVNLPDEQYIRIGTYGGSSGSIYVEVRATNTSSIFGGSVGMSGNFNLELLTDRIGNDLGSDGALAAAAWTWNSGLDPQLLGDSANGSCSPPLAGANGCVARDGACQGEGKCVACLAPGAAATACTNTGLEGPELTNCIYDVQTTGDVVTWPNAVFYTQCFDGGTACKDHGGECVVNCQKGGYFGPYCEKSLCGDGSGASGCACRLPKKLWTR